MLVKTGDQQASLYYFGLAKGAKKGFFVFSNVNQMENVSQSAKPRALHLFL